jgi:hypothetical protein
MDAVLIAFKILEEGAERPVGYEKVHCHVVFDIKMGTLQRIAPTSGNGSRLNHCHCY